MTRLAELTWLVSPRWPSYGARSSFGHERAWVGSGATESVRAWCSRPVVDGLFGSANHKQYKDAQEPWGLETWFGMRQ